MVHPDTTSSTEFEVAPQKQIQETTCLNTHQFIIRTSVEQAKVNIQDFLQVFQGSGIEKMEDNLTSADPLSYTTNGSQGELELRGRHLLPLE